MRTDLSGFEAATILVTVKAYPTPSARYFETVCVAGVRLDTFQPRWVRLYPVPFRVRGFDYQFAKYQIVEVAIRSRGTSDPRPESYSPRIEDFKLGKTVGTQQNWAKRRELIGPLIGDTSTCELMRKNEEAAMNEAAPSLGLIKPRDVSIKVKPGREWTPAQRAKVRQASMPTLFDEGAVAAELEPNPYEMRITYRCADPDCKGHDQINLDWEVGAAARNWRRQYPEADIAQLLQNKWEAMFAAEKDTHLFVGNQHQHRSSFSVLGVWYPSIT